MINNRQQNGRRRGRGGGNPRQGGSGGGGGQGQRDSGNRIDSRARGNAVQLHEKYRNMARDAQMQGDRVSTEYYLQFADHYFRVLADQRGRSDEPQQVRRQRDDFDQFDDDGDFGDEGDMIRADELPRGSENDNRPPRGDQQRGDQPRDYRGRDEQRPRDEQRGRDGNRETGRDGNRDGRDGRDGQRDDRGNREMARDDRARDDRGNRDGNREAGRENSRDDRGSRDFPREQQREAPQQAEPRFQRTAEPVTEDAAPTSEEAPRRRRVRKPVVDRIEDAPAQDAEAEAPIALEADRLPPALGAAIGASSDADEGEAPKPRRRRARAAVVDAPQV